MNLEGSAEFLNWLKKAVENCKQKEFLQIEDSDFYSNEYGTSGSVFFKGEKQNEPLTFGTFWTDEYKDAARIYVWFYIGRERDRERVSPALEKKLLDLEKSQKTGVYISRIKSESGDVFFYLDEKYFQEIVGGASAERTQEILSDFFCEVMSLV